MQKPKYFITQSSSSGDPNANDWKFICRKDVPYQANDPENLSQLISGGICRFELETGQHLYVRDIGIEINETTAPDIVTTYFGDHEVEIKESRLKISPELSGINFPSAFRTLEWNFVALQLAPLIKFKTTLDPNSSVEADIDRRLQRVIADAGTYSESYKDLIKVTAILLSESRPLPRLLSSWLADHLTGRICIPRKHGSSKSKNTFRNLEIALAVYILQQGGITPTRNDEKKTPRLSGCDIVAKVLTTKFGIPMTYSAAKKIWSDCRANSYLLEAIEISWEKLQH